jgi:hypothetical protein
MSTAWMILGALVLVLVLVSGWTWLFSGTLFRDESEDVRDV